MNLHHDNDKNNIEVLTVLISILKYIFTIDLYYMVKIIQQFKVYNIILFCIPGLYNNYSLIKEYVF